MTPGQRAFARAVSQLVYANPFLPERVAAERAALGKEFSAMGAVWSKTADERLRPNLQRLQAKTEVVAEELRAEFLGKGARAGGEDLRLYQELVLHLLYNRLWNGVDPLVVTGAATAAARRALNYKGFVADLAHFFPTAALAPADAPEHLFALFFQIRRAFAHIFQNIVGSSAPVAALRAAVWQSIFTHDLAAYRASLHRRLGDIPTLITGASGTGKELVARAVALSRYIPFDPQKGAFAEDPAALFLPLNLSALAPTLIESELFGHRKGAFTGALEDRTGFLELCGPRGSVFLDEIGELDPQIQVKLLRVLQSRTFQRIGEAEPRVFAGKLLAATNRDLAAEMHAGRFRHDLYYRLCADLIATPTLAEQLGQAEDRRAELSTLVHFIARRVVGEEAAADRLTEQTVEFVERELGAGYGWPGNFRELEQCVRNVLIRRSYRPAEAGAGSEAERLAAELERGKLTAEELVTRYVRLVYGQTGSFMETARRVGLDRRTVKARVTGEGE